MVEDIWSWEKLLKLFRNFIFLIKFIRLEKRIKVFKGMGALVYDDRLKSLGFFVWKRGGGIGIR